MSPAPEVDDLSTPASEDDRPSNVARADRAPRRPSWIEVAAAQLAFAAEGAWARLRPWRGWRWLERTGAVLFVVALPVALVAANVRVLFTAQPLYTFAVEQYDVPAVTGIPRAEIDRSMAEIRDYFTNDQQLLRITATDERGRTNPLFTPREVIHMRDVKGLVQGILRGGQVAGAFAVLYAAVVALARRRAGWRSLARLTRGSMLGALALAAAFSVAALTGFDRLFTRFHELSFSNDLWQLDPRQDRLVQMFPQDFWLVSTVLLAGMTIVEMLALLAVSWAYLQRASRAGDRGSETVGSPAEAAPPSVDRHP